MAGKINTRFLTWLALAVVVLAVGLGAFYRFVVRKSSGELVAEGDKHLMLAEQAEQTGQTLLSDPEEFARSREDSGRNYRLAAESYGRAFNRDRSDSEVLLKYIAARQNMTVADGPQALKVLQEISGHMQQATELRRDDDETLQNYYQTLYRWGRDFAEPSFFGQILRLSTSKLESDPDNLVALKYNRIARSLTLSETVDRDQQQQIRSGLEKVLAANPEDTDALNFLARWHLFDARRLQRASAEPQAVNDAVARAREYADAALAAAPNDGEVVIDYLAVLLDPLVNDPEAARPILAGLESYLKDNPDPPTLVAQVVRLLPLLNRERVESDTAGTPVTRGVRQAEALLRSAIAQRPGVLLFRLLLGNNLKTQLRLDEAHEVFLAARDQRIDGPFDEAIRDDNLRQQAVYQVANIELIRAESAADPAERERLLDRGDEAIDRLESVAGENVQVLMLRGKTALLRGDNARAMIAIDEASARYQDRNLEALLLSARARQGRRQWGAAAERLETALSLMGGAGAGAASANVRLQLAEMLLRTRRFDDADRQLQTVLTFDTEGLNAARRATLAGQQRTARLLLARVRTAQNRFDDAVATIEAVPEAERTVPHELARAAALRAGGDADAADALLDRLARQNPADLAVLRRRLAAADPDRRAELLAAARAAGVDPGTIDRLAGAGAAGGGGLAAMSEDEVVDRIDDLVQDGTPPLEVALAKSRALRAAGDAEASRRYFEEARELAPDDDRVLIAGIDYAIAAEDFDLAGRLVADAASRNLDLADGHLLRGRLDAARGRLPEALAAYERGLQARPVFDEGWKQFGDLRLQSGQAAAAADAYRTAVEQRPDNLAARLGLADAQHQAGDRDAALETLRRAVGFAPDNSAVVERYMAYEAAHGRPERVRAMREELLTSSPENLNNRLNLALLVAREGDTATALGVVDNAEADLGRTRDTVAARAGVLGIADRADEGEAVVRAYVEERGDDAEAADRALLGRYLVSVGRTDAAVQAYGDAQAAGDEAVGRERADLLFNAGRPAEAAEAYQTLLASAEGETRQRIGLRLAEAQLRTGDADAARQTLDELEPDATADALRAVIASNEGRPAEAVEMADRAVDKDPGNPVVRLQRAQLRARTPGADAAAVLEDLDLVLAAQPGNAPALSLKAGVLSAAGRTDDALDAVQDLVNAQPGNAAVREQLARLQLAAGRPDAAARTVTAGLNLVPDRPGLLALDAQIARAQGRVADAVRSLERLADAAPGDPSVLGELTRAYLDDNRPGDAEARLTEQPELLNRSVALQGLRGRALQAVDRADEARRVFALALGRADTPAATAGVVTQAVAALGYGPAAELIDGVAEANPLWTGLALAGRAAAVGDYERALTRVRALESGLAAEPELAGQARRIEALALLQTDRSAEARSAYEAILEARPDDVEALNNLAFVLLTALDDPAAALPYAERAAGLVPNNPDVLDTYGVALRRSGRAEEARAPLERSVEISRKPLNQLHLAEVYLDLDRPGRAGGLLDDARDAARTLGDDAALRQIDAALERLNNR